MAAIEERVIRRHDQSRLPRCSNNATRLHNVQIQDDEYSLRSPIQPTLRRLRLSFLPLLTLARVYRTTTTIIAPFATLTTSISSTLSTSLSILTGPLILPLSTRRVASTHTTTTRISEHLPRLHLSPLQVFNFCSLTRYLHL